MIDILAAILATWRLTQIVTEDTVFDPVRKLFQPKNGNPGYPKILFFLGCSKCVSVWCGFISLLTYVYFPYGNYPFAFSLSYGIFILLTNWGGELVRFKTEKVLPHIVLRPAGPGGVKMDYYNVNENDAKNVVVSLASELTQQRVK